MSMLPTYVAGWRESADAVLALVAGLDDATAETPTDCPGWTVRDVVAHLAHLESVMAAGTPDESGTGATELVSSYTEAGVEARRDRSLAQVADELREAVDRVAERLDDQLPDDPSTPAPVTPGGVSWSWDTLLRNRCLDMWVHEQDIRRALDRPGGFDTTAAQVVTMSMSFAMPYVLGKRVRPPAGTTVRWQVTEPVPVDLAVLVGDDGRAHRLDGPVDGPVTTLTMDTEAFICLTTGRRGRDQLDIDVDGDEGLGHAVLDAMSVTP